MEAIPLNGRAPKERDQTLFDGKTLKTGGSNLHWWSVQNGPIIGNYHDKVPTTFLFTEDNYSDFPLHALLNGSGANARRIANDEEMPEFVPTEGLFKGRHFDQEIVVLCVQRYLSYKLSYRDLVV